MSAGRSLSASEVARSTKRFDDWASQQACAQGHLCDLPAELRQTIDDLFKVNRRIPLAWVDTASIQSLAPTLFKFLAAAHAACPSLFSAGATPGATLLESLCTIALAWKRLHSMRSAVTMHQRWSEADYVGNVYNLVRAPAVSCAAMRLQCALALPTPAHPARGASARAGPFTVVPDGATFVKAKDVLPLARSSRAPFGVLNGHKSMRALAPAFRTQATPCATLPQLPRFEFVSSVWEDKKDADDDDLTAYRQNRMAAATAVRELHAFGAAVPVIGLVWAAGKVRAHVDWAVQEDGHVTVMSAMYSSAPGSRRTSTRSSTTASSDIREFHEWDLGNAADMLAVFLIVRNIDAWTAGAFCERVTEGVEHLAHRVVHKGEKFVSWKDQKESVADKPKRENRKAVGAKAPQGRSAKVGKK